MGTKRPVVGRTHSTPIQTAGWREWIGLPSLGISRIKAKLDTGARTSALHAVRLETFDAEDREWVRFVVHPRQRSTQGSMHVEEPIADWRKVTSSTGQRQLRPVIVTELECFGLRWPIELTLTNRSDLGFRMLLGREALRGRIVVDPGRSYLGGRRSRRQSRAKTKPRRGS